MTEGWKCPNCGKAHAPDVKTCPDPAGAQPWPHVPAYPAPNPRPTPTYPPALSDGPPYWWQFPVTCSVNGAGDPHNTDGGTSYSVPL